MNAPPHLAIPFTIQSDGTAATVQQGSSAEIDQCVANLVGTRPGTRYLLPSYGIVDPTFAGIDQVALQLAVAKYEPRAKVTVIFTPANVEVVVVGVAGGNP